MNTKDLENRLISFAALIINVIDELPNTKAANHLSGQLVRSGTSPALNYGEARGAESNKDFVHKLQIILKELRESLNTLKIIELANLSPNLPLLNKSLNECNELISIFVVSVRSSKSSKTQ